MPFRILAVSVILLLAGCATTGRETHSQAQTTPLPTPVIVSETSSTAAVDEHLYVPSWIEGTTEYPDVWARIVDQFALPDCAQHEASLQWASWYASQPEYMERIFKRAQPWIYYIAQELERRNMPGELALLPIVESAYDPFAYSRGRALGAWQFIGETGRRYGLKQNWWYDGRRDVWASTVAALEYLDYMNEMFDGNWLLALAGYNAGEGGVRRQVERRVAAGKPADFWDLSLAKQTQGYVPKLLGLACLFKNPAQYDFKIPATPDRAVIAAVDLGRQTDLVLISQISEVPIDVLFTLNPGFNRWATSPDGPYTIVLPLKNAALLEARLPGIDPASLMRWDHVVVEQGDSLSTLAQRHHVPVSVLRNANDLSNDTIRPGQKLLLPRDDQLLVDPQYAAAASQLLELQSGLIAADRLTHRVKSGENLSVIASHYRVSVNELQRWNNISDPRRLRIGTELIVFYTPAEKSTSVGTVAHTVRQGDSLWSIARKYNVRVNDLKVWNDLGTDTTLQLGQSISVRP